MPIWLLFLMEIFHFKNSKQNFLRMLTVTIIQYLVMFSGLWGFVLLKTTTLFAFGKVLLCRNPLQIHTSPFRVY